jgi:(S)-sulfolactate dehydrogenase
MWRIASVHSLNRDLAELAPADFEVAVSSSIDPEDISRVLADADAVLMRGPGFLSRSLMAQAPKLRVICAMGSGTDSIDVEAATSLGLPVLSGRGAAPRAIAEYVVGAMVVAHRRLFDLGRQFAARGMDWTERLDWRGRELSGTSLGIVGFGQIGRLAAKMAQAAYGVNVLAHDPFLAAPAPPEVEVVADLHELLERSDTVSLNVPLSAATRGLIARPELRRIGPDGVLINTSRGGVVDEAALMAALAAGELKAAVVDVFEQEPPSPERLAAFAEVPGLMTTPHIAGVTDQAARALAERAWSQLRSALETGQTDQAVNGVRRLRGAAV